jgi:hypothetical protein
MVSGVGMNPYIVLFTGFSYRYGGGEFFNTGTGAKILGQP